MAQAFHDPPISKHIGFLGVPQTPLAHLLQAFGVDGPVLGTISTLSSQDLLYPITEVSTKIPFLSRSLPSTLSDHSLSLSQPHLFLAFVIT